MSKKSHDQSMSYKKELINSIEQDFIFSKKPINRFKINEATIKKNNLNKIEQIKELKKLINSIQNCSLKDNSKNLVLGDGNPDASIMIIGEAPGPEEEENNKTFQGEAGALLEKMLSAINIKRENIYSSYAINFRPPEDRKPKSQEIKRYSIFLKEHISIIDPKIIILFGSTAMESITSSNERISNERGKWKEIILKNKTYPIMVTFNPSYLIRFPENKKFSWEDLKKIKQKISDLKIKI
jgi:uracil-DNA glycosylase family 4